MNVNRPDKIIKKWGFRAGYGLDSVCENPKKVELITIRLRSRIHCILLYIHRYGNVMFNLGRTIQCRDGDNSKLDGEGIRRKRRESKMRNENKLAKEQLRVSGVLVSVERD